MISERSGPRLHIFFSILPWLLLLSACSCRNNETNTNEKALKQDLYAMRSAIDQYTEDKDAAPQHLNDLVTAGYLKAIPKDPFTNSNTTWIEVREDVLGLANESEPGIVDVHSGSHSISSEGTPYDRW